MNEPSPTLEQDERFSQKLADFVNRALQVTNVNLFSFNPHTRSIPWNELKTKSANLERWKEKSNLQWPLGAQFPGRFYRWYWVTAWTHFFALQCRSTTQVNGTDEQLISANFWSWLLFSSLIGRLPSIVTCADSTYFFILLKILQPKQNSRISPTTTTHPLLHQPLTVPL